MPVISFGANGAAAFIRYFGSESMGGAGGEINAEVARTGMSAGDIGPKVYIYHASRQTM